MIELAWLALLGGTAAYALIKRAPASRAGPHPEHVILRPCAGQEPELDRALRSLTGPRVRFLVARASDPAAAIAARHGEVVVTNARGPNYKVDQLRAAAKDAEIIVVADSDVELEEETVSELVRALADSDAAWAPPVERARRTLADRASGAILDTSLHAFVVLAALDPRGMVGKLFAIKKGALERVGGFGAFVNVLGEDVEMAKRLREEGLRVRAIERPARSLACGRTLSHVIDRWARWLLVVRAQRPWLLLSYPLLFLAPWWLGARHFFLALLVRVMMALVARAKARRAWDGLLLDMVLADALLLVALLRALASRTIAWRGARLRVGAGGLIAEEARDAR